MHAYTEVIQALHNMKRDLEITIPAVIEGRDTDTEFHKEWDKKQRAAWDEIRKNVDVGEFLFSPASVQLLEELVEHRDPEDDYLSDLETMQARVEKCLPAIKASARDDLELPSRTRKFWPWPPY